MANPLVPQGTINRLRASVTFASLQGLNVTAGYLGKQGINLRFSDQVTTPIKTMTGVVPSPEPYQTAVVTIHLLKTQALADAFKSQIETSTLLGDCTIRPDEIGGVGPYQLSNCWIETVDPMPFDGTDAGWTIMIGGIYYINSALWST
jgi:hypothetical protein